MSKRLPNKLPMGAHFASKCHPGRGELANRLWFGSWEGSKAGFGRLLEHFWMDFGGFGEHLGSTFKVMIASILELICDRCYDVFLICLHICLNYLIVFP